MDPAPADPGLYLQNKDEREDDRHRVARGTVTGPRRPTGTETARRSVSASTNTGTLAPPV